MTLAPAVAYERAQFAFGIFGLASGEPGFVFWKIWLAFWEDLPPKEGRLVILTFGLT